MATAVLQVRERGVAVGRVFERGFSGIRYHPLQALMVAFLFTGLPGTSGLWAAPAPVALHGHDGGAGRLPGFVALGLPGGSSACFSAQSHRAPWHRP